MATKQISIFLPNRQGTLSDVIDLLTHNEIKLYAMVVVDTMDMGILRIISSDAEKANRLLNDAGMISKISDVLIFKSSNDPSNLSSFFNILKKEGINIEYIYTSLMGAEGSPYMIIKVDKEEEALKVLEKLKLEIVTI